MSTLRPPPVPPRIAGLVGLAACGWALRLAGGGGLTVPLSSVEQLAQWVHDTPPAVMAIALVRLAALGACGYLGLVLTLLVIADAAGWRHIAGLAGRALPATMRRAATGGMRVGLAAGTVLGAASPVAATASSLGSDPPPATATMWRLDEGDVPLAPAATATMVLLDDRPATESRPAPEPEPEPEPATQPERSVLSPEAVPSLDPPMDPAAATAALDTWEVGAGDSFWSIAETVAREESGPTPPAAQDVDRYWRRLIAANRDRLAAPDHPDLLIPGQILVLPRPA